MALMALAAFIAIAGPLTGSGDGRIASGSVVGRIVEEIRTAGAVGTYVEEQQARTEEQVQATESLAQPLDRLSGNVYLFIVESYGYTVFSNPEHAELMAPTFEDIDQQLDSAGLSVVSNFLVSPAFGGNSWLADATLTTGIWIGDQQAYDLLLESEVRPLASFFGDVGYHTVNVMPSTVSPWPEGAFFGFDRTYITRDLGYRGPGFGWAPMTDQYAIDFVRRGVIEGADRPVFAQFVLISSHYPWRVVPRLIPWEEVGDGSVYRDSDHVIRVPRSSLNETGMSVGFTTAMDYALRTVFDYAARFAEPDDLVVVAGDHQPWSGISGRDASRSAAIHVLAADPAMLDGFREAGYSDGLIPSQPEPHRSMDSFFGDLLTAFSSRAIELPDRKLLPPGDTAAATGTGDDAAPNPFDGPSRGAGETTGADVPASAVPLPRSGSQ